MNKDELLDALSSPRGQEVLRKAVNQEVTEVPRAAFGRHAPGLEDHERVRSSQHWRFATVEKIRRKLDAQVDLDAYLRRMLVNTNRWCWWW